MEAGSHIGNAPYFMVLPMAEESGVEVPGFFGYIFECSSLFPVPAFRVVTWGFSSRPPAERKDSSS